MEIDPFILFIYLFILAAGCSPFIALTNTSNYFFLVFVFFLVSNFVIRFGGKPIVGVGLGMKF